MYDSNVTDEILMSNLKDDDSRAFEVIYRRYWRRLFAYVYKQIGCKEEANEIIQDLMGSLWLNRSDSNIQNLKLFLFVSARNQVNMYFRRQINLRKYREYQLMQDVAYSIEADYAVNEKELMKAIENALEVLPEKSAAIFRMNKLDKVSINKIAVQMGLSDRAVKYHLTKSMHMVKVHLERYLSDN
jgi:RNA polymerase sigma factor (sigma-70 family)